jgi:Protein of unknown function (DUF3145)
MRALNQFAEATTGVVYIHSSPAALCPHVEWALSDALSCRANLKWSAQPSSDGQLRATSNWVGPVGTGATLAGVLRSWQMLRFEVTEDASDGVDGERFAHVPGLGLWRGSTSANGDVILGEMRLKSMIDGNSGNLAAEIEHALGRSWDDALESYRTGGAGAEVTWLQRNAG